MQSIHQSSFCHRLLLLLLSLGTRSAILFLLPLISLHLMSFSPCVCCCIKPNNKKWNASGIGAGRGGGQTRRQCTEKRDQSNPSSSSFAIAAELPILLVVISHPHSSFLPLTAAPAVLQWRHPLTNAEFYHFFPLLFFGRGSCSSPPPPFPLVM